ncbi:glycosyltransferase family 4 protein [Paraconexibacter algicola]|uniref:Glycosyltransferase subfamily 4-like N-terminal domain-containing protein n=1 Tax=Paraconexibacter algicola TaxID=2133960 RepID=A0A2T4UEQ7_9ACTN|nr:glycosyltransferase family 1 protein [Paraconexibacter algicola]PTL56202.1 hypothetical protein C7Y72_14540 [Paraconexibacter algicola]
MRVGVDARALAGHRGVGRYARALLDAMATAFPQDEHHVVAHGAGTPSPGRTIVHRTRLPRRAAYATAALTGRPRLDRLLGGNLDVVWLPAPAPVAVTAGVPVVLTVHDLSFWERPGDFTRYERAWHVLARPDRLVARADRLLADSAATRDALLARRPGLADRVVVVQPGVAAPAAPPPGPVRDRPFLLWVGALEPRKAPDVLAQAWALARAGGLDAELVVVGEGRRPIRGPGVVALGRVDDRTLAGLYRDALALVAPSWLEGFGFPPLEAALLGTPSVLSDLAVHRETLPDAALHVAPGDPRALADALVRIAADAALREDLAVRARAAADRLTWEAAARATRAALADAAGASR